MLPGFAPSSATNCFIGSRRPLVHFLMGVEPVTIVVTRKLSEKDECLLREAIELSGSAFVPSAVPELPDQSC